MISRRGAGWSIALAAVCTTGAAQVPARFPITTAMVLSAMQSRQLPVEGVRVRIAAPVTAAVANPVLEIEAFTRTEAQAAQLRVGCRVRSECLSFYVAATWAGPTAQIPPESLRSLPKHESAADIEREVGFSVRPGAPATLLIEDDKVHVWMRVVCLQSGGPGDRVRVSTPTHQQYMAEVMSPTLLRGSFSK